MKIKLSKVVVPSLTECHGVVVDQVKNQKYLNLSKWEKSQPLQHSYLERISKKMGLSSGVSFKCVEIYCRVIRSK